MNEQTRNEIVSRWRAGASIRQIARELTLARNTVSRVLAGIDAQRAGTTTTSLRRPSRLDPYEPVILELLGRYPDLTGVRLFEELRQRGFSGSYSTVRQRLRALRPRSGPLPVIRFETGPGVQAQMDYAVYDLDFTCEGRRRVNLFSYILGYSRRQYLRFVEAQDMATTLREHVRAFEHVGGVAATCLYDNMKVVVSGHEDDVPIYNPRFLAFATQYGFRPVACRVRRPQTNGKQESFWGTLEGRLMMMLDGVAELTLDLLNQATQAWVEIEYNHAVHRETKSSPTARFVQAPDVLRVSPSSESLRDAFRLEVKRSQRHSDGTISLEGVRFEIPARYRHFCQVLVRYARWDLSRVDLIDQGSGQILAHVYPLDKTANADARRAVIEPGDTDVPPEDRRRSTGELPPLLKRILQEYSATGMPPAYLPKTRPSQHPETPPSEHGEPS